ncbi:hypothetical protein [Nocardia brevicatena]|uniref:hypothetical protein n=1 Tax=Nocardia brevicatena TaxID=37327 RepID=UPI0002D7D117|nr:hypothetical protein [Nocardia brevicatena]
MVLSQLSHRHASLGVTADQYHAVHDNLFAAMESTLGPDVFSEQVAAYPLPPEHGQPTAEGSARGGVLGARSSRMAAPTAGLGLGHTGEPAGNGVSAIPGGRHHHP